MKFSTSYYWALLPAALNAAAIEKRQLDGPAGSNDATQGDLGERPPPRFPFPITKFPVAKETVVFEDAYYVLPGQVFDGKMKRYERPNGSCNEQAEGTDADTVFNLMAGSTLRNVIGMYKTSFGGSLNFLALIPFNFSYSCRDKDISNTNIYLVRFSKDNIKTTFHSSENQVLHRILTYARSAPTRLKVFMLSATLG